LGQYLGLEPHHIKFAYNSYGKPALECRKSLHFNVSHSGKFSLISFFKDAEIGIDIEESKPNFDVLDLAQNFFSKLEIEDLRKISEKEKHRAFYRCWTRKEAFIKAQGSGLSFPLNKFRVSLNNDYEAKLLNTYWDEKIKKKWSLKSFVPSTGYLAAVAVNSNVKNYAFYDWNRLNKLNTI